MATTRTGTRPWRRIRLTVIAASGGICALGGEPLPKQSHLITVDHIVPVAFGGTDDLSNLRAACKRHNSQRGVKPADGDRPRSRAW
jgi:5-methylcytosine-specific restriction endonuclease McrA